MIANLVNTILGLALVYVSLLASNLLEGRPWRIVAVGAAILILALWARRSDRTTWQSSTNSVLAVLLMILGALQVRSLPLLTFWGLFWVGTLVAVLALWAALYRPEGATP